MVWRSARSGPQANLFYGVSSIDARSLRRVSCRVGRPMGALSQGLDPQGPLRRVVPHSGFPVPCSIHPQRSRRTLGRRTMSD